MKRGPKPRELRASDGDRDRVTEVLADALADGRLNADEHKERLSAALSAVTLGDLAELTTDLVPPSAQPVRLDGGSAVAALAGSQTRDGRWVVPGTVNVSAIFGEATLDFREALLTSRHTIVYVTAIGGRVLMIMPEGVAVVMSGSVFLGRRRGGNAVAIPDDPDVPAFEVRGFVLGGQILIRHPRQRRRLFSRR